MSLTTGSGNISLSTLCRTIIPSESCLAGDGAQLVKCMLSMYEPQVWSSAQHKPRMVAHAHVEEPGVQDHPWVHTKLKVTLRYKRSCHIHKSP